MRAMPSTLLVTGGCGYLGSRLIRDLARQSTTPVTIRILDHARQGQMRALMDLPTQASYELIEGDLLDPSILRMALEDVDAVIHLAAVVRTPLSYDNPAWLEQVNHWGTAQLVEACLIMKVPRLFFTSTTAVYGPGGPHDESTPCRPQGPYAHSKLAAEKVIIAAQERGLRPTILRLGTLFGLAPVTRFDAVANRFAYLAGVRHPLTVYGDGTQRRPLVHVVDASAALIHLLKSSPAEAETLYNLVGTTASVTEIVDAIHQTAPTAAVQFNDQDILTHISFDVDSTKLRETGWQPKVSLADGLGEIIHRFTALRRFMPQRGELDDL
jgi:nucleoside-diphosphate-sugar epimerase